jgi:excisionase family DNA binding protein
MALLERDLVIESDHEPWMTAFLPQEEILLRIEELKQDLERLRHHLEGPRKYAALVGSDGTELKIPVPVYEVLLWVVARMASGQAFTLAPLHQELTTQEAAELLNVSRPYLIRLLDRGEIPYTKTGTHRRVRLTDVLEYRKRRYERTGEMLKAMGEEERDWDVPLVRPQDEIPASEAS